MPDEGSPPQPTRRARERLPLATAGQGEIVETGEFFNFVLENFSVAGVQLQLTEEVLIVAGDEVELILTVEKLSGELPTLAVSGVVRRVNLLTGGANCGIEVVRITNPDDGEALDEAYLEQFIVLHG